MTALQSQDYHHLPASAKQLAYARALAARVAVDLPEDVLEDRRALSAWIDRHKRSARPASQFDAYPSSRQVAFAERLARIRHRDIPRACFRDKGLMSRWIDSNK